MHAAFSRTERRYVRRDMEAADQDLPLNLLFSYVHHMG